MIYPVITIRQPWAALIVNGIKDVENRDWKLPDKYRNCTVLVHASAKPAFNPRLARKEMSERLCALGVDFQDTILAGHIVGAVRFNDCELNLQTQLPSPWADRWAVWWWMIEKAMPLTPIPAKGRLNFWTFDYPQKISWPEEI